MRGQTDLFLQLTSEFNKSSLETIRRWMRANELNGPLTTKAALSIISISLNVPEHELLESIENENFNKGRVSADPAGKG
jgi:hypothetical protein